MAKRIKGRIQHAGKTAAEWTVANPVLLKGELCFESDTRRGKLGDGSTPWNDLEYATKEGDAGRGVAAITPYYAVSSSKTTAPTSWSTTAPAMTTTKKYLWRYEAYELTDDTTIETAPYVTGAYGNTGAGGNDGNDGTNGIGISSISVYYARSTSGTVVPSSWSTLPQTLTTSYKYHWAYLLITYTSGSSLETSPAVIGVYGNTGARGYTGDTGPQGPQGEKGDTGATGAKGDKGDTGATGVSVSSVSQVTASSADGGINVIAVALSDGKTSTFNVRNGSKGSTGATGPQGPQGEKGDTGATGPQGPQGNDGADGQSPNITIGTVTTLAAGASATASLSGTFPNLKLNLGIPRGNTGPAGAGADPNETLNLSVPNGPAINIDDGYVAGFRPNVTVVTANGIMSPSYNVYIARGFVTRLTLPDNPKIGQRFEIVKMTDQAMSLVSATCGITHISGDTTNNLQLPKNRGVFTIQYVSNGDEWVIWGATEAPSISV